MWKEFNGRHVRQIHELLIGPKDFQREDLGGDQAAYPANHEKMFIIDDKGFYMGSDNMYMVRERWSAVGS